MIRYGPSYVSVAVEGAPYPSSAPSFSQLGESEPAANVVVLGDSAGVAVRQAFLDVLDDRDFVRQVLPARILGESIDQRVSALLEVGCFGGRHGWCPRMPVPVRAGPRRTQGVYPAA